MITVSINGVKFHSHSFVFSGGEVQTKMFLGDIRWDGDIFVKAKLQNANDIMELLQVNDILRRHFPKSNISLQMPYAPYARQDRVCAEGESLAAKVFANVINTCGFTEVIVVDCHSDVLPALIDNCINVPISKIIPRVAKLDKLLKETEGFIISPDAGANKKVFDICRMYPLQTFVRADKVRDTSTGEITRTEVLYDDFQGKPCFIFDDICDKGTTFVKLAEKLKSKGAGKISLYVTHAILPNDNLVLECEDIDTIYATDSFDSVNIFDEKVVRIKL